jgi:histidinol-phosphate aminotransferase
MFQNVPMLQLQYGVNAFAADVYKHYKPLEDTAMYPDPESTALKQVVAAYAGCDETMVLCGNGSDEFVDLYIRMYALERPHLQIAIAPPTYYQYSNYGQRVGAAIVNMPHDRRQLSALLLKKHGCSPRNTIVMLDSPANPSGDVVGRTQFINVLEAGYHVFADEAYSEFCGKTVVDLVKKYPRQLVVSRSLSKSAGMAGTRVGYVIASEPVIEKLRRQKLLFNLGTESQSRALYALQHMNEFIAAMSAMRAAKASLLYEITKIGSYQLFDSLDMYIIFAHRDISSQQLRKSLETEHKISTYRFADFKGHDVLRATVLRLPLMRRFTDTLQALA